MSHMSKSIEKGGTEKRHFTRARPSRSTVEGRARGEKENTAGAFAKQRKGGDIDAKMLNRLVRGDRKSAAT